MTETHVLTSHEPVDEAPVSGAPASTAPVMPAEEYHHSLRRPGIRRWRGAVAILAFVVGYLIINTGLVLAAGMIDIATGAARPAEPGSSATRLTPLTLLAVNLSAAAMIPLAGLLQWAIFRVRPRWLSSVAGRFRWRLVLRAAAFMVPIFVIYVVAMSLAGPAMGMPLQWAVSVPLLLVVVTTTWLQAAGEEYGFRGFITRSVGSWFDNPRTALLVALPVANVLFMLAHFAQDPWLIAYYFVFGAAASVISWRTGGLEVSALMHATNNVLLFVSMALTSGGTVTIDRGLGAGGPFMLIPMAVVVLVAALVSWWSARVRPQRQGRIG